MQKTLFVAFVVLLNIFSTHQILRLSDLHRCTQAQIQRQPLIEVVQTSSSEINGFKKQFLGIKVIQKQQRLATSKMIHIQEKVKMILRKHGLARSDDLLVMTNLRPYFVANLRKWDYSMIFAIVGEEAVLAKCFRQLTVYGIFRIKDHSSINFLNQKITSIDAFNKAKAALVKFFQKIPKIQIKSIEEIDIIGKRIKNQALLQHQIKSEGVGTDLNLLERNFAQLTKEQVNLEETFMVNIRVIFKVGSPYIEPEQDSEDSEYSTDQYSEDTNY